MHKTLRNRKLDGLETDFRPSIFLIKMESPLLALFQPRRLRGVESCLHVDCWKFSIATAYSVYGRPWKALCAYLDSLWASNPKSKY